MDIDNEPRKIDVYVAITDFMKIGCNHQTSKKLELLKNEIRKGNNSPSTASINIFNTNLFIFSYEKYLEMYKVLNGELS